MQDAVTAHPAPPHNPSLISSQPPGLQQTPWTAAKLASPAAPPSLQPLALLALLLLLLLLPACGSTNDSNLKAEAVALLPHSKAASSNIVVGAAVYALSIMSAWQMVDNTQATSVQVSSLNSSNTCEGRASTAAAAAAASLWLDK
jgi:hypothetical protein